MSRLEPGMSRLEPGMSRLESGMCRLESGMCRPQGRLYSEAYNRKGIIQLHNVRRYNCAKTSRREMRNGKRRSWKVASAIARSIGFVVAYPQM